jgi:hypothetical protein
MTQMGESNNNATEQQICGTKSQFYFINFKKKSWLTSDFSKILLPYNLLSGNSQPQPVRITVTRLLDRSGRKWIAQSISLIIQTGQFYAGIIIEM